MWKLSVIEDRGTEVELGLPTAWRVGGKVAGVGFALFGLVVPDLFFFLLFVLPIAVWFWKSAGARRTIRFDDPAGHITVDYYRWTLLGAWRIFKTRKSLPLSDAGRMRSEYRRGLVQTSPTGAMLSDNYMIYLPDGAGNSFKLWEGDDPEVQRLLEGKIREAVARHTANVC